jgi:addiction module HigA family antidote
MKTKNVIKRPAVHPGEILIEYLEDAGLSQSEAARRLHVPIGNINEICRGKRGISPLFAKKLARLFGNTPELWMNLQRNWEISLVDDDDVSDVEPIKRRA